MYAEAWKKAWAEDTLAATQRAQRARSLLPALVQVLVTHAAPTRIFLMGSLARATFGMSSDIDLVVEGLPAAMFFRICGALDRVAGEHFRVDLVRLESARPFVWEAIQRGEVELLYHVPTQR